MSFSLAVISAMSQLVYEKLDATSVVNIMMIHRKVHGEVKDCIDLIKNQCSRGESCWWNHNLKEQVFRQVKENLPPPIQNSHVMQQEISQQEIQMSQQHQTM